MKVFAILVILILILLYLIYTKNTSKNIEHFKKIAKDEDIKQATKYAYKKMCQNNGYVWINDDGYVFDCKHSKETCLRDSVYPTKKNASSSYYEWRDYNSEDAKKAGYLGINNDTDYTKILSAKAGLSSNIKAEYDINRPEIGGICIVGNEALRSFCEEQDLRYDPTDGKCYTTPEYCKKRLLHFCNGDCFEDPVTQGWKGVLGETLGTWASMSSGLGAISYGITAGVCK